jgi:hypothetical protein
MSFASSSISLAQNIPARSPPLAAIGRENDTRWCDAFYQQNCASSQTSWLGSHPTVAESSKSLGFQVEADWPEVSATPATA